MDEDLNSGKHEGEAGVQFKILFKMNKKANKILELIKYTSSSEVQKNK